MIEGVKLSRPTPDSLVLECTQDAFRRVHKALELELDLSADLEEALVIHAVHVINAQHPRPSNSPHSTRDRIALLGCALVAFVVVSIFFVGLNTVITTLRAWN